MKSLLLILLFIPALAWAQADSLRLESDTLRANAEARIDSLQNSFTASSDSIRNSYTEKVGKLARLRQKYAQRIDSLKGIKNVSPDNPLDTLGSTVETARYTKKLDSLDNQIETLQRSTTARLDSVKSRVTEKLSKLKLPKGSEGKVAGLTSAMDKVNVPSFNTDLIARSGLSINRVPALSQGIPGNLQALDLPNLPNTNVPDLPSANLPGVSANTPTVNSNLPTSEINTGKLNDITGQAGDIQKQVKDATGSTEGLGNALETKAGEELKGLPENKLPETPGLPGGIPKTGDEAKEQLVDMAKKEAVNHFAGKEQVLMSAMEKMSKYKQKYNSVSSLKDLKDDKPHNELRGKPLRERLVPALTLQFQSWQDLMLDINPSVGYKLNSHMVVGLGWNQRIAFNIPDRAFNRYSNVHGIRSYGEYTFKKGFGLRADLECMNTPLKRTVVTDSPPERTWVWSAMIGIKQRYPIYKKLKGNAQLMYNLFDRDHRSPYTDRINWRIGIEFTLKRKKKPEPEKQP